MLRFQQYYQVKDGDNLGDPNYWNNRLSDIDSRLNACESQFPSFTDAVNSMIDLGVQRIDTTITPQLANLTSEVNSLSLTVSSLNTEIEDQASGFTTTLNGYLATASGLVTELEDLGTADGGTF